MNIGERLAQRSPHITIRNLDSLFTNNDLRINTNPANSIEMHNNYVTSNLSTRIDNIERTHISRDEFDTRLSYVTQEYMRLIEDLRYRIINLEMELQSRERG